MIALCLEVRESHSLYIYIQIILVEFFYTQLYDIKYF